MTNENIDIMIQTAWMYYYEGKTQSEISKILKISRQKVQRLLNKAKEEGIVQVKISDSAYKLISIKNSFKQKFSIDDAIIVPTLEEGELLKRSLARATADYLSPLLKDVTTLGLGMGSTLSYLPDYIETSLSLKKDFRVVSLLGNLLSNHSSNPLSIGLKISEKLGVPYYGLWAPYRVDSIEAAKTIKKQEMIARVLEMVKKADISVVGIGGIENRDLKDDIVNEKEVKILKKMGAVGDILGKWFDIEGRFVYEELSDKIIGANVKTPGTTVGVAGGKEKIKAIFGALKGNLVDIIIIDEKTAEMVLRYLPEEDKLPKNQKGGKKNES
ncbi:MAG TPA: sugar-binding domain-containing protein [Defluviitoga sp.]|nr:sugar-binding domain-containing protein [Defluviitoga sp.]HPZ74598.1 sugar-binding domain-containing protein [Candidatus Pacearchaeota archaeon]